MKYPQTALKHQGNTLVLGFKPGDTLKTFNFRCFECFKLNKSNLLVTSSLLELLIAAKDKKEGIFDDFDDYMLRDMRTLGHLGLT